MGYAVNSTARKSGCAAVLVSHDTSAQPKGGLFEGNSVERAKSDENRGRALTLDGLVCVCMRLIHTYFPTQAYVVKTRFLGQEHFG